MDLDQFHNNWGQQGHVQSRLAEQRVKNHHILSRSAAAFTQDLHHYASRLEINRKWTVWQLYFVWTFQEGGDWGMQFAYRRGRPFEQGERMMLVIYTQNISIYSTAPTLALLLLLLLRHQLTNILTTSLLLIYWPFPCWINTVFHWIATLIH